MKTIYFIRHAESEANAGFTTINDNSIALTAKGREQAAQLANAISFQPDLIICSKYIRTQQTAAPLLLKYPHIPVKILPIHEFTYLSPKACTGTTTQQRQNQVFDYWDACSPQFIHGEEAESFMQFTQRIDHILQCLEMREANNIIAFTHGHVLRAIWQQLAGYKFNTETERMHYFHHQMSLLPAPNTCIYKATFQKNQWQIIEPQFKTN